MKALIMNQKNLAGFSPELKTQICINTNSFRETAQWERYSPEKMFCFLDELGCKKIELSTDLGSVGKHCLTHPDLVSILGDALEQFDIECVAMSGGWCDFYTNDIQTLKTQIDICLYLGIKKLRLFLTNPKVEIRESITARAKAIDNLKRQAYHFVKHDICCLIENHGGLTSDPKNVFAILGALESEFGDKIGTVFDPANYKKYCPWFTKEDLKLAFERVSRFIKHVHVKDINEQNEFCLFGTGIVPWSHYLRQLIHIGYDGYLSIEHEIPTFQSIGIVKTWLELNRLLSREYRYFLQALAPLRLTAKDIENNVIKD